MDVGRKGVQLHLVLTSTLDGGECSASRTGHFTPRKNRGSPLNKRLGGPSNRSALLIEENRKSAVKYGAAAISTKVYSNSGVVFVILAKGKLTLHVEGNVAAYTVSHPNATDKS
jgi:hypothetical protein